MTDSKGNVRSYQERKKLSKEMQSEKLEQFRNVMMQCLQRTGTQAVSDYYDMMMQPTGQHDALLYFSKTEIDSSEKMLKQKIAYQNGTYCPASNEEKYLLNSIFEIHENGRPHWYLLQANKIILTRNLFDNKWIAANREEAVPYYRFGLEWKSMMYQKSVNESSESYIMLSKKNYNDKVMLINTALYQPEIDSKTDNILACYRKRCLSEYDMQSNEKTAFLFSLYRSQPEHSEVYHAFELMRKFLKKQTGTRAYLHYKGNDLIWNRNGREIRFHVCRNNCYNVGGLFYDADQLKQQIEKQISFPQKEWYQPLIPFFSEKEYIQERK